MRFTLLKKIAFGDNSKVRFSVVRKVFYTFLHHKILAISIVIFLSLGQLYLYGQEKQDAMVEAGEHYRQGKELYSQGRYEEADIEFEKAVELMKAASASAQTKPEAIQAPQAQPEETRVQQPEQVSPKTEAQPPEPEKLIMVPTSLSASSNVTLDFKEADIRNVLKIISYKAGVNIVSTPEVVGDITIRLVDVPWEKALDVILKTHGFGYERIGNIITVAPIEKLTAQKKQEVELTQVQPTITEVFNLRYIDAQDAKKAIEPQLSPRGKITVLETTGQAGWEFGSEELSKRKRVTEGRVSRSKTLIISDIPPVLEKIRETLQKIDVQPQQVIIQAKLIEVNHDKIKDLGFSWGTGTEGRTSLTTDRQPVTVYYWTVDEEGYPIRKTYQDIVSLSKIPLSSKGTKVLGMQSIPSVGISELIFQKLTGTEFEAVLKVLEDRSIANTLSAPHITTLNNQEASILIGSKFPLIKATVSTETGAITGQSLDKYQDIGIQLNVVPQISGKDYINLIIHPAVSTYSQTVKAVSATGVTMAEYPIIIVREAETQILIKDGGTVVIGGLMKDVKSDSRKGIPILMDIPFLGFFFRRDYTTTSKVDLLVFLTARIVREGEFTPEEIARLEKELGKEDKSIKEK
jgi:type IV pilus assembly protein PilQ